MEKRKAFNFYPVIAVLSVSCLLFSCQKDVVQSCKIFCGDFEDITCFVNNWHQDYYGDTAILKEGEAYSGNSAMYLANTTVRCPIQCLEKGLQYELGFYCKIPQLIPSPENPNIATLIVSICAKQNLELRFENTDTNWVRKKYQFFAPENNIEICISTDLSNGIFIDQFSIDKL